MGFRSLRTYQFRNLLDGETDISARQVFFVGENGQGKTNLLEAIYLLCFGASFRTTTDALLISGDRQEAAVEGVFRREESGEEDRLRVTLGGAATRARKEIRVNDKVIRDRKEIVSTIPCIIFSHDDMSFVTGPPDRRRWFFNQTMSLHEPTFIDLHRRYQKLVQQRNTALREHRTDLLEIYEAELASSGLEIQQRRITAATEFNEVFVELFREVSGLAADLTMQYHPAWKECSVPADAMRVLAAHRAGDIELGTTTSGPHRDRFVFTVERHNFARIASTGQLRLMSLILRVAQAVYFRRKTGRKPLLLLDDVLLELDLGRRERFLSKLPEAEQRFFTFLPDEQFRPFVTSETLVYTVEKGGIRA